MAAKKKTGLGKGLGALIPNYKEEETEQQGEVTQHKGKIPIKKIRINPWQPRKEFDQKLIEELADSIKTHGLIQPITVRRKDDHYEIISGERRYRASKLLGVSEIDAYIREDVNDKQMLEMAIIENLQREDLNPVEVALSYKRLIDEFSLTQDKVAERVGKNRSTVTNMLRLLKLPDSVLKSLKENDISVGHARALLSLDKIELIISAWKEIVKEELSVRDTEQLVKDLSTQKKKTKKVKEPEKTIPEELEAIIEDTEDRLRSKFGTDVKLKMKTNKSGSIVIDYYSKDDLDRILEILE